MDSSIGRPGQNGRRSNGELISTSIRQTGATKPLMSGRLSEKVCVITGTGGSIGRASAIAFAKEGALVVGCDVDVESAESTVEIVRGANGEMVSMQPCRLDDPADCEALVELALQTYGAVHVLFNLAAISYFNWLEDITNNWNDATACNGGSRARDPCQLDLARTDRKQRDTRPAEGPGVGERHARTNVAGSSRPTRRSRKRRTVPRFGGQFLRDRRRPRGRRRDEGLVKLER